jgi:hypothetical protein
MRLLFSVGSRTGICLIDWKNERVRTTSKTRYSKYGFALGLSGSTAPPNMIFLDPVYR